MRHITEHLLHRISDVCKKFFLIPGMGFQLYCVICYTKAKAGGNTDQHKALTNVGAFFVGLRGGDDMAKAGRKGKYSDWLTYEGLLKVEAWARNGLSDEQIAKNIGIAVSTLYEWKNRFPEFSEALKKGKEVVDIEVENALLKRALGHQVVEETKEALRDPKTEEPIVDSSGNSIMVVTKQITKNVPPDVTAQIFWLKNRKPDVWRDRKDIDMQANIRNNPYEGLTEDQLKKLAGSG